MGPLPTLSILLGCSLATGAFFETSSPSRLATYLGVPMPFVLVAVSIWSCYSVYKWQNTKESVPSTALVVLTIVMSLCGIGCLLSTTCRSVPVIALNILIIASVPVHWFLCVWQWGKIGSCPRTAVAISAPLTLVGIVSTGLSAIFPAAFFFLLLLLIHSSIVLAIGLYKWKIVKNDLVAIVGLVLFLASLISSFISSFVCPFWFPVAVIALFSTFAFVNFADSISSGPCSKYGLISAVVQLALAAAAGVAITTDISVGWVVASVLGMLASTAVMGIHLARIHMKESIVTRPLFRVFGLVVIIALMVALIAAYHFLRSTVYIPYIFVAITALCILACNIVYRLQGHAKYFAAAAGVLLFASFYFFNISLALSGGRFQRQPEWREHLIAMIISIAFLIHLIIVTSSHAWKSKKGQQQRKQRRAAAKAAAPAPVEGSKVATSLAILFLCSILTGIAMEISWMAGVPMLFVFFGVGCWSGVSMRKISITTHRIVSVISLVILMACGILSFLAYFHAPYLCWVTLPCILCSVLVLNVQGFISKMYIDHIRVSCVLQLLAAAAAGVASAMKMNDAWTYISMLVLFVSFMIMTFDFGSIHWENYVQNKAAPVIKRPRLLVEALIVIAAIFSILLMVYIFAHISHPICIPFIFFSITALYLTAVHIIFAFRDKLEFHLHIGLLLICVLIYFVYACVSLYLSNDAAWETIRIPIIVIALLAWYFLYFSYVLWDIEKKKKKALRLQQAAAIPLAAAPAAPIVIERDVDSDYESIANKYCIVPECPQAHIPEVSTCTTLICNIFR